MSVGPENPDLPATAGAPTAAATARWPGQLSRVAAILAIVLVAATFFLASPPRGETYPGAIPWRSFSVLRPLTELMSLNGLVATARGIEIKDLALHLAAIAGLLLAAARLWHSRARPSLRRRITEPWLAAQLLLLGWVVLSLLSTLWSSDRLTAYGQAALYALALGWALPLAWTLEARDAPRVLAGVVAVSAVAGGICLWYYLERNPYHRPGFPFGNPGTLAAALIPAILLALGALAAGVARWRRTRRFAPTKATIGAAVALIPLGACFVLTNSRAAALGLLVGIGGLLILQSGRRLRWILVAGFVAGAVGLGLWLASYSRLDAAMARSATVRFRLYAWRYAAELWDQSWLTSILGQGAGAYPRLAGQLSIGDRALDPAAFMGELVEHAHNELFEVLTEIGLVGGVTFVGGWLATLAAGALLLRRQPPGEQRWLSAALVAGLAGLMGDALTSPNLRLAGVPAVFYTLLGTLWALCRSSAGPGSAATLSELLETQAGPRLRLRPGRVVAAGVVVLLALGAIWVTARDWRGALREEAANAALAEDKLDDAQSGYDFACGHLLDPVRQLVNQKMLLQSRLSAARAAYSALRTREAAAEQTPESGPTTAALTEELRRFWRSAVARAQEVHEAAEDLGRRAPTLMHAAAAEATAAELLAELLGQVGAADAQVWAQRADEFWRLQRRWRPYDVETLLALTQYSASLPSLLGFLRDALRSPEGLDRWGEELSFDDVRQGWNQALRRLAPTPGFGETLDQFVAVIGPASPQTDPDSLMASGAPEVCRLKAHFEAWRGDYAAAREFAARAARLYEPLRPRLPTLQSVALLDQAEFALRDSPEQARLAVELLQEAIRRLPVIQQQKYAALALPFRVRLAAAMLAAGDRPGAAVVLRPVVGEDAQVSPVLAEECVRIAQLDMRAPGPRPTVDWWLQTALKEKPDYVYAWSWIAWRAAQRGDTQAVQTSLADAERAGIPPAAVERIRRGLCQEFPDLCEQLRSGPRP